jgi:hypothetical protein
MFLGCVVVWCVGCVGCALPSFCVTGGHDVLKKSQGMAIKFHGIARYLTHGQAKESHGKANGFHGKANVFHGRAKFLVFSLMCACIMYRGDCQFKQKVCGTIPASRT